MRGVGMVGGMRRHSAFTLIELVITVAIIAALAGLLIPATMSTITSARVTACASNLRQIGVAVSLYAGEHRDRLPAPRNGGDDNPATSPAWFFRLPAFTGERDVKRAHSIFQCAAFRWKGPVVFTNATPKSLKMNGRLDQDGRPPHYRLGTFTCEQDLVLFVDSQAGETGMGQWGHSLPQSVDDGRHRGRVNVLALDGHAQRVVRKPGSGGWNSVLRWLPE